MVAPRLSNTQKGLGGLSDWPESAPGRTVVQRMVSSGLKATEHDRVTGGLLLRRAGQWRFVQMSNAGTDVQFAFEPWALEDTFRRVQVSGWHVHAVFVAEVSPGGPERFSWLSDRVVVFNTEAGFVLGMYRAGVNWREEWHVTC